MKLRKSPQVPTWSLWISLLVFGAMGIFPVRAEEPPPSPILKGNHSLIGKIWLPSAKIFSDPETLLELAFSVPIIVLGETHDNHDHHALQAWVVRRLVESGQRPTIALEMIETDYQEKIDTHLSANPKDVNGLAAIVEWEKRGWSDWDQYARIFKPALEVGGSLRAANLPRKLTREIGRGQEDEVAQRVLRLNQTLLPHEQEAFEAEIRVAHCNLLPDGAVGNMVRVQRARDASMADAVAAQAAKGNTVVLIAGAGHARRTRGVPMQLSGTPLLTIAFVEVRDGAEDPLQYSERYGAENALPFDAVWFTARAERADQCEELARQMKGRKPPG